MCEQTKKKKKKKKPGILKILEAQDLWSTKKSLLMAATQIQNDTYFPNIFSTPRGFAYSVQTDRKKKQVSEVFELQSAPFSSYDKKHF